MKKCWFKKMFSEDTQSALGRKLLDFLNNNSIEPGEVLVIGSSLHSFPGGHPGGSVTVMYYAEKEIAD